MTNKLELSASLIHIFEKVPDRDEALLYLAKLLESNGYVKDSYGRAVLERERVFPTGLPTQPFGIALPHTDCEHVKRGAIAVGILPQPISFQEMGSCDGTCVDVHVILMLAIPDPDAVTEVLRELALLFQDADFLTQLVKARDAETVLWLFSHKTPAVVDIIATPSMALHIDRLQCS